MLVLTRKRMEKLYIGGDICVTVVRLEGRQVRLGIEAPRDVPVVRAELKARDADRAAQEAADGSEAEPAFGAGRSNGDEPAAGPTKSPEGDGRRTTRGPKPAGALSRRAARQRSEDGPISEPNQDGPSQETTVASDLPTPTRRQRTRSAPLGGSGSRFG